jgi:hypothetical protein
MNRPATAEETRLASADRREANWRRWGPYLPERQWGTVREDYSAGGQNWESFPYERSLARAYRWGEDGLLGITDRECRLCLSAAADLLQSCDIPAARTRSGENCGLTCGCQVHRIRSGRGSGAGGRAPPAI